MGEYRHCIERLTDLAYRKPSLMRLNKQQLKELIKMAKKIKMTGQKVTKIKKGK